MSLVWAETGLNTNFLGRIQNGDVILVRARKKAKSMDQVNADVQVFVRRPTERILPPVSFFLIGLDKITVSL